MRIKCFFIWTNLNPLYLRIHWAKFGWNCPSFSGEDFLISSMYFRYFVIISPWKRAGPFIWTNMNPLYPWMLCAKFGWNWPSGFWVEVKNTKSLQTEGQTDDGWQAIGKGHLSLQLRWAKNDNLNQNCHYLYLQKTFL